MGDWNTLHHFDDKKFYSEIVPDLKGDGELLRKYFNSDFGSAIVYNTANSEERITDILHFCQSLDHDLKAHEILLSIQNRQKETDEKYADFIRKQNQDESDFRTQHANVIDDINRILTLIIFSECAAFNPHLIVGRTILTGSVDARQNSIAAEVLANFTDSELGSIYYGCRSNNTGLINWVTNEDLQLLWLDRENLFPTSENANHYFTDFFKFIEIAIENDLGVFSGTNMHEQILKLIQSPLPLDLNGLGMVNVINFE